MASRRFGPTSQLHQRDPRSALFDGYEQRRGGAGGPWQRQQQPAGQSRAQRVAGARVRLSRRRPGRQRQRRHQRRVPPSDAEPERTVQRCRDRRAREPERRSSGGDECAREDAERYHVAIGDEIRDSSKLADSMNDRFERTRTRLRGTMTRMLRMAEKTGVGWRVWLAFFAAVALLFWYVWLF